MAVSGLAICSLAVRARSSFVQGGCRSGAQLRDQALTLSGFRVLPQEREGFEGVTVNTDGSVYLYSPDTETIGRLRGLGRFLRVAGEKIADASSEIRSNSWLRESFSTSRDGLHVCGTCLRDAAAALVQEQWAEADQLIGTARAQCGTFLPKEHLATLQKMLADSQKLPGATDALRALSAVLEGRAELPPMDSLQDLLVDAASALRTAARLFAAPASRPPRRRAAAQQRADRMGAIALDAVKSGVQPAFARELEESVANAPGGDVQGALRALAKKYHPDRHPGAEMTVLPMFRHVQQLREERRWGWRA